MKQASSMAGAVALAVVPLTIGADKAEAAVVYTHSELQAPATSTRFVMLSVDEDRHRPPVVMLTWGSRNLPGGSSDNNVDTGGVPTFDAYALIGLDSSGGVFVTFADPNAAIGRNFASVFPGFNESEVAAAMVSGAPLLDSFVAQLDVTPGVATKVGVQCECTHFSTGASYGTFIADFSPVPSPGSSLVVLAGGAWTTRRRRARGG